MRPQWKIGLALIVVAAGAGCVRLASGIVAFAPNCGRTIDPGDDPGAGSLRELGVGAQLRIEVGPPAASLLVWLLEPPAGASRGTVLLLHGLLRSKRDLLGLGKELAAHGYRCVLVDLRGHGRSSGGRLTYGVLEKRDLTQVLDALASRGLLVPPVAAWGYSYGGAAAIELAAIDERVRAVVALAPFSSLRAAVEGYAAWVLPLGSDESRRRWSDAVMERACVLARADLRAGQPVAAVRSRAFPLLLVHGQRDRLIGPEHSEALFEAACGPRALLILRGVGHNDVLRRAFAPVLHETIAWLDRWLPDAPSADRKETS